MGKIGARGVTRCARIFMNLFHRAVTRVLLKKKKKMNRMRDVARSRSKEKQSSFFRLLTEMQISFSLVFGLSLIRTDFSTITIVSFSALAFQV